MTKRKPPIRHKVKSHTRQGKPVRSFERGRGTRTRKRKVIKSHVIGPEKEYKEIPITFREWDISQKSNYPMRTPLDFNFYPKELIGDLLDKIVYSTPYEEEYREYRIADTKDEQITFKVPTGWEPTEREARIFENTFDILKDESNWKMKTHYAIVRNRTEADLIARGTKHFTGGAEIYALSDGTFMVGSEGYYHYTGA